MHRTIGYLSKRFVQVRPGEGKKVFLTSFYFFLVITAYYLIKPASRALVLGDLGSRIVPYGDLVCAVLMGPVVTLFAHLVDRVSKPRLISGSFWVVIGILFGFWCLFNRSNSWVSGAFYVWVSIFSVLVVTFFWLVANDLYRPREAKRLFGLIGSGGIVGGIVGSSIASIGAQMIGTRNLLLISIAVLVVCWAVVQQLWKLAPPKDSTESSGSKKKSKDTFLSDPSGFAKLLLQSRYLLLLVVLVGIGKLVGTLIYYQFNPFIEETFLDPDAKTTFLGIFFGGMNVLAFVIQFFFTSWILRRWGLSVSLFALPVGLAAGTITLLALPLFWIAAVIELFDGSLNYSLQQTTKEVLFLPINRSIRYKVKPFIDMVVFRFGKGIAAVMGIVMLDWLNYPARSLGYVAIPLLAGWLAAAVWLRRDYIARIRTLLQAHSASRRQTAEDASGTGGKGPSVALGSLVNGLYGARKLALLEQMIQDGEHRLLGSQELLAALTNYEQQLTELPEYRAAGEAERLKAMITDPSRSMSERRYAVQLLVRSPQQPAIDFLLGVLTIESDATLRNEVVRALVKVRLKEDRFEFPVQLLRRLIAQEVANYQRIVHTAQVCRRQNPGSMMAGDPLLDILHILLEESVEQIFRLLMLLYRPEDIQLIYEHMRCPESFIRADAIELLDNLVDSTVRGIIFPILDEDRFLSVLEDPHLPNVDPAAAYRLLQSAIWDHNCWLSVAALCAVGRLRLAPMRQEVEKAARHKTPAIASAAKVALSWVNLP